jgi:hypothetical protein
MKQFASHRRPRPAFQFWRLPTTWSARDLYARSPNPGQHDGNYHSRIRTRRQATGNLIGSNPRAATDCAACGQQHHENITAAELESTARAGGVELSIHQIEWREEIGSALDAAKATGAGGLNVLASTLLFNSRAFILRRVAALRLPAVFQFPEMAEQGGLIGYGPRIVQLFRDRLSRQLANLLRGSKPGDIPVEQPTKFELVINLKTAKAVGLDVPPTCSRAPTR